MGINSTSLTNTPQAGDDTYTSATTGLTEDSLFISYLAVMANDLGGAAKTLYSLDNGTNSTGALSPTDLLTQDMVRTEALTTDRSAQGAKIWITTDGKVGYDAATLSTAFQDQLQHLSAGQFLTDTFTYAIRLGNGTLSWATATVQIAGVNDAPVVTGAMTGAALEDGSSVTLNALANASDVDSGATLSVTNLPGSLPPGVTYDALAHTFTLDPSNPAFQHLAAGDHTTVTVNYGVTDGTATTAASVSWSVAGTNDAPVVTGAVTGTAVEDDSSVTLDALANASDVDSGATLSVTNLPGSLPPGVTYDALAHTFTLDPSNPAFQHLAAGDHTTVTVNYGVTDGTATTAASVSWSVAGTNDAPVISSNEGGATATLSVDENSTSVTTVTATDADDGATQTYSIVGGADASLFTMDAATGALSFNSAPDSEASADSDSDNVYNVTVRAFDGVSFDDQALAVTVHDVNEFAVTTPADTNAAADAIDENSAIGTVVGVTARASDADATTNVVSYSLTDDADGKFAIDSATGVVTVAGAIDREADASLDITVRAISEDGSSADQVFTIAVNDVNEFAVTTPADTDAAANAVDENAAVGTLVGVATQAIDADATTHLVSYGLIDNAGGRFAIDATTGIVTVAGAIDREADASLDITVRATSEDGTSSDQVFTIAVNDVDEFNVTAPTDTDAASNAVDENSAIGTVVGMTAYASDADATTKVVSYSLTDDADGKFAIDSATGVVTVAGAIDREADASLGITVRATSLDGSTADQSFNIAIKDVNDNAPAFSSGTTGSEAENTAASNVVYDANATDADGTPANNTVTYSLSGTDSGLFSIDASSGEVRFLASPNHEAPADADGDNAYQIVVRASDGANDTAQGVTVTVTDVVENHVPTDLGLVITNSPGGNSLPGAGTVLGAVSATDPDAGDTFTFSLLAGSSSGFSLNASSGSLTTTSGLAERSTYTLDIQVTDAAAATYHEVFNIITGTNGTSAAADDNPLPSGGPANPALAGDDVLYGSGGNDVIYGGSGNDWIFGQNGLDRLIGGAGNDTLSGGNQSDTFVFLAADGGGADTVVSFTAGGGNGDVLDLSNLLAGSGYTAANAAQYIHLAEAGGSTTLQVDLDGSGSGYSFEDIALLQGLTGLNLGTLVTSGIIDTTP